MLKALAELDEKIVVPQYAHLSMILGNDGQKAILSATVQ